MLGTHGQHDEERVCQPRRDDQAGSARCDGEREAFDQPLAEQAQAAGAEREADGHLAPPLHLARKNQVRDVAGGDQQQHDRHHHQQAERQEELRADARLLAPHRATGNQREPEPRDDLEVFRAERVAAERIVEELLVQLASDRLRLLDGGPGRSRAIIVRRFAPSSFIR